MRASPTWKRAAAGFLALGLVVAACGDDDDDGGDSTEAPAETEAAAEEEDAPAETEAADDEMAEEDGAEDEGTDDEMAEEEDSATGESLALEGQVEIAAGTVLNLDECPDDWDPYQGVDGDEIRIGQTLPQSGALAAFGALGDGMQFWFDYINETDPIDGKELVLVLRDDGYEAGRAVANVEEMLDTEDLFSFMHNVGTPINFAVRPILDEACVPAPFNSSGDPAWGDPANFPWTSPNILAYSTEASLWCESIVADHGEGASVAALIMNNDFGKTYQNVLEGCEEDGLVEIAALELHDQAAPDVTPQMTTLIGTGADAFVAGTTAAFCPQTVGAVHASEWRPSFYMSYTCNSLSSFFEPVKDAAGELAADGSGVRMTNSNKVCGDAAFADDPAIIQIEEILQEYGGLTCADGSYWTGVLYGQFVTELLQTTIEQYGELNRVNMMAALWNSDTTNDTLLGGTLKLDGVNDAYWTEAAQLVQVIVNEDDALAFEPVTEVFDVEGQGGSVGS